MNKNEDLTGKTFYYLTVLYRGEDYINPNGYITPRWHCLCKCGNEKDVSCYSLLSGKTKSCGCYNKKHDNHFIDLVGQQFGNWKVIKKDETRKSEITYFICECMCEKHTIKSIKSFDLRNGNTLGCEFCTPKRKRNKTVSGNKKYNKYDLSNDYGIGFTNKGEKFYFDKEDYDKIKDYCWSTNNDGYLISQKYNDNKKTRVKMHRLVMNITEPKIWVDHINHNVKDNRKINLRIVQPSSNGANSKLSKNNTSGVTGVHYATKKKKWIAVITVNRKLISLGSFVDFEDAVKARKNAEEKYYGKYSYDNSMKEAGKYKIKEEN